MKNFILFGPPGIGKSTVIGILKTKGIGAIDLEDFYPNRIRFQVPNLVRGKILGAADLTPKRGYNAYKILLTADQDAYDARRSKRDSEQPGKANQDHHDVSVWNDADYDLIVNTTKQTAAQTAAAIANFYRRKERTR